jgi:hypothetical protein
LLLVAPLRAEPPTHSPPADVRAKLFGMRGFPPIGPNEDLTKLLPLIDQFGQYRHADWPGKTKSPDDLLRRKAAEAVELADQPGPKGWDQYGGWQDGPQLTASGRFRAAKHDGKWWLVDPEGRLFWSHGIDCVGWEGATPITDREPWFTDLPAEQSPLGVFYGQGHWGPHNYYEGKNFKTYNFAAANLSRKYGNDWQARFAEIVHRRLRSWGMNTIGNWSNRAIYALRKTPYVITTHVAGRPLAGSEGYWGRFVDVFDPDFAKNVRRDLAEHRNFGATDPWCLGYFVDNELSWGDELSLAVAALRSPAEQPAKQALLADLRKKYDTIERLNAIWGTRHASWSALSQQRHEPDKKRAYDDLAAFASRFDDLYFRTCRDAVKELSPQALYLGCRFAWVNDRAVRAAAPYCDVLSFNRYQASIADFRLPSAVDKPVIIGEFHFGALDRGPFHTGLVPVADQAARAAAYRGYVGGALRNPLFVGTHWFQFGDQPTTGRGDGENYQIGFLDVCDTPYAETIQASRAIGAGMYAQRLQK